MGVRLFPRTRDTAKLEKLARVPAGTADLVEQARKGFRIDDETLKAESKTLDRWREIESRHDRFYEWIYLPAQKDLLTYWHFVVSGWGKFDGGDLARGYTGELKDVELVDRLFKMNGIDADAALTEGVYWC